MKTIFYFSQIIVKNKIWFFLLEIFIHIFKVFHTKFPMKILLRRKK